MNLLHRSNWKVSLYQYCQKDHPNLQKPSLQPPKKIEIIEIDDDSDEILSPQLPKQKEKSRKPIVNNFGGNFSKLSQPSISRKIRQRKRPLSASQNDSFMKSENKLWVDKYAPTDDATELCVAPKKVNETRDWLLSSWQRLQGGEIHTSFSSDQSKFLVLIGSPGIGKSTMIQVLANELDWSLLQWKDHFQNIHYSSNWDKSNMLHDGLPNQSQLSMFEEFLMNAGSGYRDIVTLDSNLQITGGKKINHLTDSRKKLKSKKGTIIVIDEIPNIYSNEAAVEFRNIMTKHITQSLVPTVFIFSDVAEGKHRPDDLERLIEPSCLYSPLVKLIQCNQVTKPKMKKVLQNIWRNENKSSGSFPEEFVEDLHMINGGDLRNAILTFQFQFDATNHDRKRLRVRSNINSNDESSMKPNQRDERLSTFHALGKLLYAKRKPDRVRLNKRSAGKYVDDRHPLNFDPENVMENCTLNSMGALAFLGFHSPDFFTDITELSNAFDLYSDASFLDDKKYHTNSSSTDGLFPGGYVSSLASRAVAQTNKNPAPNKFRQLNAPAVFEVMKKKGENIVKMDQLKKRLSVSTDNQFLLHENLSSSNIFVTDTLPFLRSILPSEVNYALSTLHSYARPGQDNNPNGYLKKELDDQIMKQEQILKDDDILDEDTDSDDVESLKRIQPTFNIVASRNGTWNPKNIVSKIDPKTQSSCQEEIFLE